MKNEILILVDYNHFLRNAWRNCSTLNLETIKTILLENNFKVEICSYQDILQMASKPKEKFIWYASSNFLSYKNYIEDILLILKDNNVLIPPFDIFRAHDNKGYQSLLREKLSLPLMQEYYFGTLEELDKIINHIKFPIVLKGVRGSGSTNVTLVHNKNRLRKLVKRKSREASILIGQIKRYLKRYIFTNKYTYDNSRESLYYNNFLLQEYVPDLTSDWKVLIFYDKYYVFEREVRRNDFRASGSGKFYYRNFDLKMLDFCQDIFQQLDTPWISLDVCYNGHEFQLLEYQGTAFGPIGLLNAPYYFVQGKDKAWQKIFEKSDLSTEYALAFIKHARNLPVVNPLV